MTPASERVFHPAKLGTAYCTWPRQFGEAISRAQHPCAALRGAALDVLEPIRHNHAAIIDLPDLDGRDYIPMVVKIDLA